MIGLYKIGVRSYTGLLHLLAPFNSKADKWVKGRKGLVQSFSKIQVERPLIWFHCASLGEFEQGKPVMEEFKKTHPNWLLLVTFFSPSGYELRKDYERADFVYYLPAENSHNVRSFLDTFSPTIAVFVKYEFWYEYLNGLFDRNIPSIFISSTFRNDQIFFKPYGKWFLQQLNKISRFFVQDKNSLQLLNNHSISDVTISGDTRYDRVYETLNSNEEIPLIPDFIGDNKILIFGSAWETETEYALSLLKVLPTGWKVIFAPHEIYDSKIQDFIRATGVNCVRFTELNAEIGARSKVLVLDTVGHLARLYKYGDLAFVGGGYNDGIHNILEPLTFGVGVFFGPLHKGFPEAEESIKEKIGFEVLNVDEFLNLFMKWSEDSEKLELLKSNSKKFITSRIGATRIIMDYLNKWS